MFPGVFQIAQVDMFGLQADRVGIRGDGFFQLQMRHMPVKRPRWVVVSGFTIVLRTRLRFSRVRTSSSCI